MKIAKRNVWAICIIVGLAVSPSIQAFEIRHDCDIRVLGLSMAQRDKLQIRRQQYKDELRQTNNDVRRHSVSLQNFFSKVPFDKQQAERIAQEHYADDVKRTIAELNFYHDFFHMLNKNQKDTWLDKCVR